MIESCTIGPATLFLGDCFELLRDLPHVDAVVTDPPYGCGFAGQPTHRQRAHGQKPERWDDAPVAELGKLLELAETRCVWGGNYYSLPPSRGWLCWYKPNAPPSMASFELAWTNIDQNARQFVYSISATNAERVGHPTQKPRALMEWTLATIDINYELRGRKGVVFDPFMGSGTTGVACINLGLSFVGVEIDERYYRMACDRITAAHAQRRLFP